MASVSVGAVRTMLDFNKWATEIIFDKASELTQDEFSRNVGLDHGSIRGMLAHMVSSAAYLRSRASGVPAQSFVDSEEGHTADSMRDAWRKEDAALRAVLDSLGDDDLDKAYDYEYGGKTYASEPVWQILFQLAVHDTQHRSEVATALTQLGHSPGNIDFLTYTWRLAGHG